MSILPANEAKRLRAVNQYTFNSRELEFDRLTSLAALICGVPISLITLIKEHEQVFVSRQGLEIPGTARDVSFCRHAILQDDLFEIEDSSTDERFADNPLVTGNPHIRFYAGYPLIDADGYALGTICVIDRIPRKLTTDQRKALRILAEEVMFQFTSKYQHTQLANARQQLRISEKRYQLFFENALGLLCIHDLEGNVVSVNPSALKSLGYRGRTERSLFDVISPRYHHKLHNYLRNIVVKGKATGLINILDKKGRELTWVFNSMLSESADGALQVLCNAIDITSRIAMEKKLQKTTELAINHAKAKDQLLANVSHEMRTPLNAIIGFAALLDDAQLSEKQHSYVKNIATASEALLGNINDLLDMAKIESGTLHINSEPFNLHDVAAATFDVLQLKANEKSLAMQLFIHDNVPAFVCGDEMRLNQVLINLISNAIKFTEKGSVTLSIELVEESPQSCQVQFAITDTGIGIARESQEAVFERFMQADNGFTRRFGGTGLGLSICRSLVEMQNGKIWLESESGKGSTFTFIVPYGKTQQVVSKAQPVLFKHSPTDMSLKILLVEDNMLNQLLATTVLENFNFIPELAEDGREAVEKLKSNTYDLILMDVQMPGMDGYQASEIIRNELKLDTPIIAMTANSLPGEKEKCIAHGMNDYINKPFDQNALFDMITFYTGKQA